MRIEIVGGNGEDVVDFLVQYLPLHETILSALRVKASPELSHLLRDVVSDCIGKGSATRIGRDENGEIIGVCIATANTVLEKQLDRLYEYTFKDDSLRIVNEFAQTVFNRADIPYHVEEANIRRPLFIALLCVRPDKWGQGIGRQLLEESVNAGKELGCDGAFALASSEKAEKMFNYVMSKTAHGIPYDSWKGEHRNPPINPIDPQHNKIYLKLGRF